MASTPVDILTRKLNGEADAKLKARIDERFKDVRNLAKTYTMGGPDNAPAVDLIDRVSDRIFRQQRDSNRSTYIDAFIVKVNAQDAPTTE